MLKPTDNLTLAAIAHPFETASAIASAERAQNEIQMRIPHLYQLLDQASRIESENASFKVKYRKMRDIADQIADGIAPSSACRRGCAHCCYIAVTISAAEAEIISYHTQNEMTGRGVSPLDSMDVDYQSMYRGVPCPFLQGNECSIYEHRPIACRIHFSLADNAFFCDLTKAKSAESAVPNIDLRTFFMALVAITWRSNVGDIREFFTKRFF
jgi:Fe-S-cluster containining protein